MHATLIITQGNHTGGERCTVHHRIHLCETDCDGRASCRNSRCESLAQHGLAGVHEQQVIEVSSTEARWSMNRMERNSKPMDVCLSAAPSQLGSCDSTHLVAHRLANSSNQGALPISLP